MYRPDLIQIKHLRKKNCNRRVAAALIIVSILSVALILFSPFI